MRTWDFFDTLMGRACGEPWRVFELMGGEEFKRVRQAAEQKSDKTWAGIYRVLQRMTGWSDEKIAATAAEEFEWERKLAFPITANLAQVSPGDMVITDTYFDAAQIRALGDQIGLPNVTIHASYGDKHHGRIWQDLKARRVPVTLHTGDNKHADYDMARRYSVPAQHYIDGAITTLERGLQNMGHWDVAALSRCVRLQNPYASTDARHMAYKKQASYNVPFLLLIAARLRQYIEEHKHRHVYFVTRDMGLVRKVFTHLYPDVPTDVFYASRQTFFHPTDTFLRYARKCAATPNALFVDLQGTGRSAKMFQDKHKIQLPYLFCAAPHRLPVHVPVLYRIRSHGTELEVFNYDTQGRVLDVVDGKPVRANVEYDVNLVEPAHKAVDTLLPYIFQPPTTPKDEMMQQVFYYNRYALSALVQQHVVEHKKLDPADPDAREERAFAVEDSQRKADAQRRRFRRP